MHLLEFYNLTFFHSMKKQMSVAIQRENWLKFIVMLKWTQRFSKLNTMEKNYKTCCVTKVYIAVCMFILWFLTKMLGTSIHVQVHSVYVPYRNTIMYYSYTDKTQPNKSIKMQCKVDCIFFLSLIIPFFTVSCLW